jgi:predicted transcriptional regulator of viral defense system
MCRPKEVVNTNHRHYIIAKETPLKPRRWDTLLYDLAEGQLGYFTAAQAREAGLHPVRLVQLHQHGDIERLSRGVYRLTRYPLSQLGQYMEAALWPQVRRPDANGIVSHESALAIYGLSDVSPARVHVTLPNQLRIRRAIPRHLTLHYADLEPHDVQHVEGVPVTTAARSIRDVHETHLGPALVRQAIADGRRTGHLTFDEAEQLERELLGKPARSTEKRPQTRRKARA